MTLNFDLDPEIVMQVAYALGLTTGQQHASSSGMAASGDNIANKFGH